VVDRLELQPGQRALDVASGTGRLAFELAARVVAGGTVDGVDAASEMVDYASPLGEVVETGSSTVGGLGERPPAVDAGVVVILGCGVLWPMTAVHPRQVSVHEACCTRGPGAHSVASLM
jgi:SAM-dependent methyltransferase